MEKYFENFSFQNRRKLIRLFNRFRTISKAQDLNFLATIYKTDKWGKHFYTPHYKFHFSSFRKKKLNILEIGIGGYESPTQGGGSLRMWERFFPNAMIYGLDIYDKSKLEEGRIKIIQGSQIDRELLTNLSNRVGGFEIIIDDGSHQNEHIIESFKILFPLLKNGGIYVVEDTQTSYWKEYGGDELNIDNPKNAVSYFKSLIHGLNHSEMRNSNREISPYEEIISSVHFYHNLIFIYKGVNPFNPSIDLS
ncbi:cephalosporin hydroxylase [Algoriphagus aquaeductus]|uniref:Cephalosporin hydroxylase n=1 Tax=Algoriphagus aquaeductus TaxID=475299 RepID=A0A326RWZ6_9BACT|nr:CmcI family methyltransferase [Algoriphagus aquaeductus]PZV79122.1 cephalosporin hydroxylase [Algoriphagus aquaeductus]